MWQIRRIYLDSIGTAAGRFIDVTLDLSGRGDDPADSVLWLRNGGGKSTIMALLGALVRPGRNDFLSAAEHRNDAGRHLEDYVLGSDTAHIAVEWADGGRRLVTGAVYEWADRVQPADPNSSWDRLGMRWYAFAPDGDRAELARLPFRVAGRAVHQEAFCTAVRALPPACEPVVARTQADWERTLAARGIDPDLWRTIVAMNESEGGIEHQFLFADADDFVRYLLRLIVDPEVPGSVARILGQVVAELAARPAVEADLRFCTEAADHLTRLDAAHRADADAAELVAIATADARMLRASLLAASDEALVEAGAAAEEAVAAAATAAAERALSEAARDTANEYARLAAVIRQEAAASRVDELVGRVAAASAEHDAWAATRDVAELAELSGRAEVLTAAVAAAEVDAAPLAAVRALAAARYATAIRAMAAGARAESEAARREAGTAAAGAEAAKAAREAALAARARGEEALAAARRAVARHEADLEAARETGTLRVGEGPAEAAARLAREDSDEEAAEASAAEAAESGRASLAADAAARDLALAGVHAAATEAEAVRGVLDTLRARRDALASEPRMGAFLPAGDADVIGMGRPIAAAIADSVRAADAELTDIALDGAEDARALASREAGGLLPPAPDLARALAALADAGIDAVSGWRYLADAVTDPLERAAAYLAAPDLAAGALVQDPAALPSAVEALAGLRATTHVPVATTRAFADAFAGAAAHPAVSASAALFDTAEAAADRTRREGAAEARARRSAAVAADRDADRALGSALDALLRDAPPGRLESLARDADAADTEVGAAGARLKAVEDRIAALTVVVSEADARRTAALGRRRAIAGALAAAAALAAGAEAVAPDRLAVASLPSEIASAATAAADAAAQERALRDAAASARERELHLGRDLAGLAERAAALADPEAWAELPDAWSLEALASASHDADAALAAATTGSAPARELAEVERERAAAAQQVATLLPEVRERATALLAQPDGATVASRARATAAAAEHHSRLTEELGEAKGDKRTADAPWSA